MKRQTIIFSVFGQIDAVIGQAMYEEGKANKIPPEQIPPTALFDTQGRRAHFALAMPVQYESEYNERVRALRA